MLGAPAFDSKPAERQLSHTLGRFRKVCETCVSVTNAGARLGPRRRRGRAYPGIGAPCGSWNARSQWPVRSSRNVPALLLEFAEAGTLLAAHAMMDMS